MKKVKISNVKLGEHCFINKTMVKIVLVEPDYKKFLIAWNGIGGYSSSVGIGWEKGNHLTVSMIKKSHHTDDINEYDWYHWVISDEYVMIDEVIINKDQMCMNCNLPAPHCQPNMNDKFVCVSCMTLTSLES